MVKRQHVKSPGDVAGLLGPRGYQRPLDGKSELEECLVFQLRAKKIGGFKREVRFHPQRMWRFDLAFLCERVAIEVEGGAWSEGRHTRGGGFEGDCTKLNEAAILGWSVLRFTSGQVVKGEALKVIERMLARRRAA